MEHPRGLSMGRQKSRFCAKGGDIGSPGMGFFQENGDKGRMGYSLQCREPRNQ